MCQKTHSFAVLTRSFFDATQWLNKNCSSTFHGVMFLFHTYWDFFLTDWPISRIGSHLLPSTVKYYVRVSDLTNDVFSQSFVQHAWNKVCILTGAFGDFRFALLRLSVLSKSRAVFTAIRRFWTVAQPVTSSCAFLASASNWTLAPLSPLAVSTISCKIHTAGF